LGYRLSRRIEQIPEPAWLVGHALGPLPVAGQQLGCDRRAHGDAHPACQGTDIDARCWVLVKLAFHCFSFGADFVRSTTRGAVEEKPLVRKPKLRIGTIDDSRACVM
jgi:hypothetical protein